MIRYSETSYPTDATSTDGTDVAVINHSTSFNWKKYTFIHEGLSDGTTYYYSIFTEKNGIYSDRVTATATTAASGNYTTLFEDDFETDGFNKWEEYGDNNGGCADDGFWGVACDGNGYDGSSCYTNNYGSASGYQRQSQNLMDLLNVLDFSTGGGNTYTKIILSYRYQINVREDIGLELYICLNGVGGCTSTWPTGEYWTYYRSVEADNKFLLSGASRTFDGGNEWYTGNSWETMVVDLSTYIGNTNVDFQWLFESTIHESCAYDTGLGGWIDSVLIEGVCDGSCS